MSSMHIECIQWPPNCLPVGEPVGGLTSKDSMHARSARTHARLTLHHDLLSTSSRDTLKGAF